MAATPCKRREGGGGFAEELLGTVRARERGGRGDEDQELLGKVCKGYELGRGGRGDEDQAQPDPGCQLPASAARLQLPEHLELMVCAG